MAQLGAGLRTDWTPKIMRLPLGSNGAPHPAKPNSHSGIQEVSEDEKTVCELIYGHTAKDWTEKYYG